MAQRNPIMTAEQYGGSMASRGRNDSSISNNSTASLTSDYTNDSLPIPLTPTETASLTSSNFTNDSFVLRPTPTETAFLTASDYTNDSFFLSPTRPTPTETASLTSSNFTNDSFVLRPTRPTPTETVYWYDPSPKLEEDTSSLNPPAECYPVQSDSQFTTHDQHNATRWTPNSLDWTPNSDLLKLYKFVVKKSKEPYFELLSDYFPTFNTPAKVYLDYPE
jgi:hypothetical protein